MSNFSKVCVTKNTHELAVGDIVRHYNAVFKLVEKTVYPMDKGDCPELQGDIVVFHTELLEWKDGPMPKHWAEDWRFQGNKLAVWAVIAE